MNVTGYWFSDKIALKAMRENADRDLAQAESANAKAKLLAPTNHDATKRTHSRIVRGRDTWCPELLNASPGWPWGSGRMLRYEVRIRTDVERDASDAVRPSRAVVVGVTSLIGWSGVFDDTNGIRPTRGVVIVWHHRGSPWRMLSAGGLPAMPASLPFTAGRARTGSAPGCDAGRCCPGWERRT